jgi:hypothetical protein
MAKLIFILNEEHNREASKIEFTVPDDMNIQEYKVMCVRLASSLGYTNNSIKKAFGDLIYGDDEPETIRQLLNELNINPNNRKTLK